MMEQPFSTSKVTVEFFDPHDVYKFIGSGLSQRLPLRNLHWQSHSGPLRSIDVLWVELIDTNAKPGGVPGHLRRSVSASGTDDGFQTPQQGGKSASSDAIDVANAPSLSGKERRHQIPGLRRTPYLKVLFVRCDDNETYKSTTRAEIREWIKKHTPPSQSTRKVNKQENHDAFEWLVVHVVLPNTGAAGQPRFGGKSAEGAGNEKSSSRWRTGSSTLLEKMRSDFNVSGKSATDRVAQVRIAAKDVPGHMLPAPVPTIGSGYQETEQDAENAWHELITKFKGLILTSFDLRVTQYEDDIREKDAQRLLPGWNFCTFFILKEGLARGFESVGLVEDALVGYDELSVGLDNMIREQLASGEPERHGGSLLDYTDDLRRQAEKAVASVTCSNDDSPDEEEESKSDKQSEGPTSDPQPVDEIPISPTKKLYRDMIVANNVSVFDFRCYIFSRQVALLLRLGNAWSSREDLLAKLQEQQDSVLHGTVQHVSTAKSNDDTEDLSMLAEICRRTLQFVPAVSQVMRADILSGLGLGGDASNTPPGSQQPANSAVVDNMVSSFVFSVAQQILAQTSTKSLPIPITLGRAEAQEPKSAIPEPKTMIHPARSSSLRIQPSSRPLHSPGVFPGPGAGRRASVSDGTQVSSGGQFLKTGLEDLAARRAELYALSRNVLKDCGKNWGWDDGWASVPDIGEPSSDELETVDLDGDDPVTKERSSLQEAGALTKAAIENRLLRAALEKKEDFYHLYQTLTDKALRHYTVADHTHAMQASTTDLAVLQYHLGDYAAAAEYFLRTTPFYGVNGWSLLEFSMLVMYSNCLQQLERKEEYVRVVLTLLAKTGMAQKEQLGRRETLQVGGGRPPSFQASSSPVLKGLIDKLLAITKTFPSEVPAPLTNMFTGLSLSGGPEYDQNRDGFTLAVKMHSLLVDDLKVEKGRMRLTSESMASPREIWLELATPEVLRPGKNMVRLHSKTNVTGRYNIDRFSLISNNIHLHYERELDDASTNKPGNGFRGSPIALYRPTGGLDCRLAAAKHIQLDKNNSLDLTLSTGWNTLKSCDIRVRPNTGGLRLLTTDAQFVGRTFDFAKPPEAGSFHFGSLPAQTTMTLQFSYSTEQDVASISVKIDVSYTTDDGTYLFSATPTISVSLSLGVNVQDVFKHHVIFSRFSVSTATPSPLILYRSELENSDAFESQFGTAPSKPVVIFPKQPASLLFKITRKSGVVIGSKTRKTLYLTLHYSVVLDRILEAVTSSLVESFETPELSRFVGVVIAHARSKASTELSAADLERAALLGAISTGFLVGPSLDAAFLGLGPLPGSKTEAGPVLRSLIKDWQESTPELELISSAGLEAAHTISIPVDVPSVPVLHTADIQLQKPLVTPAPCQDYEAPIVAINQLLPATLHLKWTRAWDTTPPATGQQEGAKEQEFIYEVNAPPDTWLLGGRKRGRIVVPAAPVATSPDSASESAMEVPLLMVPLREGWLPYPSVEIREAKGGEDEAVAAAGGSQNSCETDYCNLGETVRVIADREKVTLSLDSSGPGGGPLVVESERRAVEGRIVF